MPADAPNTKLAVAEARHKLLATVIKRRAAGYGGLEDRQKLAR